MDFSRIRIKRAEVLLNTACGSDQLRQGIKCPMKVYQA